MVDFEAAGSGVERTGGFEVADLGLEDFCVGNVGRVGNDDIEGFAGDGGEQVRFNEADPVGDIVAGGVLAGNGQCESGDVEGGNCCSFEFTCQCDGDGSGAGPDVGDVERGVERDALEQGFDEVLGLGAGDEDVGRDAEGESVEFLFADDVLNRFVASSASEPLVVGGLLAGREFGAGVGEEKSAILADEAQEQQLGVTACAGEMLQECCSVGEGGGEGNWQEMMVNCRRLASPAIRQ